MPFETTQASEAPDAIAPDGSEVRLLAQVRSGSMAHFRLPPGQATRPVAHRTVEELWYVLSGRGRMWRSRDGHEDVTELTPGVSLSIPVGTRFQFRADGDAPLDVVGVTMPPWPGEAEAREVDGHWEATL